MDDFQLRLLRALERLAGRDGPGVVPVSLGLGDRLDGVAERIDLLVARLDAVTEVLQEIRDRLAAIHEDLPGGGGGGPP